MSGRPLAQRATEIIHKISWLTKGNSPIIGVGGIRNSRRCPREIERGATLVQPYTGFSLRGSGVVGNILRKLTYIL